MQPCASAHTPDAFASCARAVCSRAHCRIDPLFNACLHLTGGAQWSHASIARSKRRLAAPPPVNTRHEKWPRRPRGRRTAVPRPRRRRGRGDSGLGTGWVEPHTLYVASQTGHRRGSRALRPWGRHVYPRPSGYLACWSSLCYVLQEDDDARNPTLAPSRRYKAEEGNFPPLTIACQKGHFEGRSRRRSPARRRRGTWRRTRRRSRARRTGCGPSRTSKNFPRCYH